jgi:uracil-DNA glycosylase
MAQPTNAELLNESKQGIDKEYLDIFRTHKDILAKCINTMLKSESITPPVNHIFDAFKLCKWNKLSVILIGQDPYPKLGDAHGLSFSSKQGIPQSVRVIYKSMVAQNIIPKMPTSANLTPWAEQGMLLLNAALTTIVGSSNKHLFWHEFTKCVVSDIIKQKPDIILILLGAFAIDNFKNIGCRHVLTWGHPSPLSSYNQSDNPQNFIYCDVFRKCNTLLSDMNKPIIRWDIEPEVNVVPVVPQVAPVAPPMVVPAPPAVAHMVAPVVSRRVIIATDGASYANGKPHCIASWATCVYAFDDINAININTPTIINGPNDVYVKTAGIVSKVPLNFPPGVDVIDITPTNNRGELYAIYNGLTTAVNMNVDIKHITLLSDSEYALKSIFINYRNWVAKKQLADKKNIDLIELCVNLVAQIKTKYEFDYLHINSHTPFDQTLPIAEKLNWALNNDADVLATTELKSFRAK